MFTKAFTCSGLMESYKSIHIGVAIFFFYVKWLTKSPKHAYISLAKAISKTHRATVSRNIERHVADIVAQCITYFSISSLSLHFFNISLAPLFLFFMEEMIVCFSFFNPP